MKRPVCVARRSSSLLVRVAEVDVEREPADNDAGDAFEPEQSGGEAAQGHRPLGPILDRLDLKQCLVNFSHD